MAIFGECVHFYSGVCGYIYSSVSRQKFKYFIFAPLYMLFFWMVNPLTIVTTFIPAMKACFGKNEHSGAWVSPTRKSLKKG
ncbi:MAG: glycosyl transferase, partial [Lactococcus garvieae]